MLLRTLRNHQPLFIFAIPVVALLLGFPSLLHPLPALLDQPGTGPWGKVFLQLFQGQALLSTATALLLMLFQAYFINHIFNKYELTVRNTYLPAVVFLILISQIPAQYQLNAPMVGSTFVLFALQRIFQAFNNNAYQDGCVEAGLCISFATLCYVPYSFFFLFVITGMLLLRPFSFREILLSTMGFLLPLIFLALYRFYHQDPFFTEPISSYIHVPTPITWPAQLQPKPLLLIAIPLLVALFFSLTRSFELGTRSIQHRGRVNVMRLQVAFSLLLLAFTQLVQFNCLYLLLPPTVFWMSCYYIWAKKYWVAELTLWLSLLFLLLR